MKVRLFIILIVVGGLRFISPPLLSQEDTCSMPPDVIDESEIDKIVASELELIDQVYFHIDESDQFITYVEPTFEPILDIEQGIYIGFTDSILVLEVDLTELIPTGDALLLYGDFEAEEFEAEELYQGSLNMIEEGCNFHFSGELNSLISDGQVVIDVMINYAIVGSGTSEIEVEDNLAYITGDLGTRTYQQFTDLIENHPEVDTLILADVPGSVNDAVNMHTGRLIREAGYTTYVPEDGLIASGGVDLFIAGSERFIEEGAKVGVHSWCCVDDTPANELDPEHAAHEGQKAYFSEMMGDEGIDFYFYTLQMADFDDIYYMSTDEIIKWSIAEIVTDTS